MSDTTQTPAAQGSNQPKLAQLLLDMEDLGRQDAEGKDVQIKFDLKIMEAANAGLLDTAKDKHGDGIDDAVKMSEAYAKGRNKAVIFDHKEPKQRKLASTTRTLIRFASSPKWGVNEPMSTTNDLLTCRQALRRRATNVKLTDGTVLTLPQVSGKLDDAHNTMMRFAREQLKLDTMITVAEAMKFCFRNETEPRTPEDLMRQTLKQYIALSQGKLNNCPELDDSQEVKTIINACNRRLSAIAKAKGGQAA